MKAVDNVNTIIAPTLVGKVGSIYSTIMLLTKEFFYWLKLGLAKGYLALSNFYVAFCDDEQDPTQ